MILPIVSAIAREVIATVPAEHKEAALALGATRWEMIRIAVLPVLARRHHRRRDARPRPGDRRDDRGRAGDRQLADARALDLPAGLHARGGDRQRVRRGRADAGPHARRCSPRAWCCSCSRCSSTSSPGGSSSRGVRGKRGGRRRRGAWPRRRREASGGMTELSPDQRPPPADRPGHARPARRGTDRGAGSARAGHLLPVPQGPGRVEREVLHHRPERQLPRLSRAGSAARSSARSRSSRWRR